MSVQYHVHTFLDYDLNSIWALPEGKYEIITQDGEVVTTTSRRIILSRYFWQLHQRYPKVPIRSSHMFIKGAISAKKQNEILSAIYKDWCDIYYTDPSVDVEDFWYIVYEIVNGTYNDLISKVGAYVTTISALDVVSALDHPAIKEANREVLPTQYSIDQTYEVIEDSLNTDSYFNENAMSLAVRSKIVDMNQVCQCLGPRGFLTEIDSSIYKDPVTVGYGHGLRRLHDALVESRSATKSLMFNKDLLSDCEYYSRRLQIVALNVDTLVYGDCGSTHTLEWTVKLDQLKSMEGIYYHEGDYNLKVLSSQDTHLGGKTIYIRTPFGCILENRQSVCSTCCGQSTLSIPRGTNVGHVAAIAIGERIAQLVLSLKHVEGSSKVDAVDLDELQEKYLVVSSDNTSILLHRDLRDQHIRMIVDFDDAYKLGEVLDLRKTKYHDVENLSKIRQVTLLIGDPVDEENVHEVQVPISKGSRVAHLTDSIISHLCTFDRLSYDVYGNFVIDLYNFDLSKPLFELPLKHTSMVEFAAQVEGMIFSSEKDSSKKSEKGNQCPGLSTYSDPAKAISDLLDLVKSRLSINMTHIMLLAYVMSAVDPKNHDYRFPRGGESFSFIRNTEAMTNRSKAAKASYESQLEDPILISSYVQKCRPYHPMDAIMHSFTRDD